MVESRRDVVFSAVLAFVIVATVVISGCRSSESSGPVSSPSQPAMSSRRILFDMAHGEIFGAENTSDLGQSKTVAAMRDAGFTVVINEDSLTDEVLSDAAGLVLPGPMRSFTETEKVAIDRYVEAGGTVLLTVHVPVAVAKLSERFGLQLSSAVVQSTTARPGTDPGELLATTVREDPLTEGVKAVHVISGWAVQAVDEKAKVVVGTDPNAWADFDSDGTRTERDPAGAFGVVGAARVGFGAVVVLGDDAILANIALDSADNRRLLENIIDLFAARSGPA